MRIWHDSFAHRCWQERKLGEVDQPPDDFFGLRIRSSLPQDNKGCLRRLNKTCYEAYLIWLSPCLRWFWNHQCSRFVALSLYDICRQINKSSSTSSIPRRPVCTRE